MYSQNNVYHSLTLESKKEVYTIKNNDSQYNSGTLTCQGGGSFHKGLSIGMQETMVNGLLIYDDENFFGYSEKNGLILLSMNYDFKELELPEFGQILEKKEKILNIDLSFRDIINYYINIPNNIVKYNIDLVLNIKFMYDDESLINQLNFYIINKNDKKVQLNIINNQLYVHENTSSIINENNNSVIKLEINYINEENMIMDVHKYIENTK